MTDEDPFRRTMRQVASGVFVITTGLDERMHATTATAFLPLSATPPMVLVCLHRDSDTHRALTQTTRFGVNVLAEYQAPLSARFAGKTSDRYRFDDLPRFSGPNGVTFLSRCAAHIEVETTASTAGGDHTIFIGRVTWTQVEPKAEPLVYHHRAYHRLAPLAWPAPGADTNDLGGGLTGAA
jgi:flavin reductase (DIM6/NTAB) family NADH-FMN oxidoreductase RutF